MRIRPPAPRRLERVGELLVGNVARAAVVASVCCSTATAGTRPAVPPPRYPADTVRVDAPRPRDVTAARVAPRFVTIVPARRAADAFADLGSRIAHAAGVSVRSTGGPGAVASVSIRGSSSNQVEVFYDGIPLGRARDGAARLADAPLAGLARVEVSRGFAPFELASAPLGGTINLVPRDDAAHRYALHASGGSWRTAEGSASAGFGGDAWRATTYATWLSSAGDFAFLDDNATPYNSSDDERTTRRNNALRRASAGGSWSRALDARTTLTGVVDVSRRRSGLPGIGPVQATSAAYASDQALAHLRLSRALGRVTASVHVYDVATHERFTDTHGELGGGNQDNDDRTVTTGIRTLAAWHAGAHAVSLLGELAGDRWRSRDLWPRAVTYPLIRRTTRSAAAEYAWTPFEGRLTLAPSYRVEEAVARSPRVVRIGAALPARASGLAPRARTSAPALAARVAATDWLAVKGHTGRYRRLPTFVELFGERGAVSGNPALRSESGTHSDAGVTLVSRDAHATLELAAFAVRGRDLVVFVQNSQRTSVAQNVSAARIDGCELTAAADLGAHLHVDANATWQTARDVSDNVYTHGRLLPGRPLREYFVSVLAHAGVVDMRGECASSSGVYLDRAGRVAVPAATTWNAGLACHVGGRAAPHLTVSASVTNLTDARSADLAGYPLPGRALYLSVDRAGLFASSHGALAGAATPDTDTAAH